MLILSKDNWNFPHKIYFREKGETPEKVMDVLEHMNKSLEKEEGIGNIF